MALSTAVVVDGVSYHLADGTVILNGVSATFPPGLTALIGPNGSGKTTLLRLIAGDLAPTAGAVRVSGRVHLVPQDPAGAGTVAELLGIAPALAALRAIEGGSTAERDFDAVGDDWDVEARALAELSAAGLPDDPALLSWPAGGLSGGEATKVALIGARLSRADVTLLDEPTNNLDGEARTWLLSALTQWQGAVVVVSHDRDLLQRVTALVDLDPRGVVAFGGNLSAYLEAQDLAQTAAERRLRDADAELARSKRALQAELQRKAQRDRSGAKERARGNVSKGAVDFLSNRSEKKAGSKSVAHQDAVNRAVELRKEADAAARTADTIRIDLPETTVPSGKAVVEVAMGFEPETRFDAKPGTPSGENRIPTASQARITQQTLAVVGPERIRVTGGNGVGKSTLLALLQGRPPQPWWPTVLPGAELVLGPTVPTGVVSQRLDHLNRFPTAIDAVRHSAPGRLPHDARALLARFLIRGDKADQPPATLSGGERFRLGLAQTLFSDPAPRFLILDEPTNNLDLTSVEQLVEALDGFRGALIVVTHDDYLAEDLRVTRRWDVSRQEGSLQVDDVLP